MVRISSKKVSSNLPRRRRPRSRLSPASSARSAGRGAGRAPWRRSVGFVAEHDDLDRQFVAFTRQEPEQLEGSNECQVEEGQRHGPSSTIASRE